MSDITVTADQLETLERTAELGHVFTVTPTGRVVDGPANVYAPECYHDESSDITLAGAESDWEALTGYTGQYSYAGAVMHASEYLGGRLARDILETPGTYVLVSVEVLPEDVCRHCDRPIIEDADGRWVDPEATGDDSVWRETCDRHDAFTAEHERDEEPEPAGWAVLRHRRIGAPVSVRWYRETRPGQLAGEPYAGTVRGTSYVPVRFADTGETVPDVDTRVIDHL